MVEDRLTAALEYCEELTARRARRVGRRRGANRENDSNLGWLGEPFASDFMSAWGIILLEDMFDARTVTECMIRHWRPVQATVIAAAAKAGKTWLMWDSGRNGMQLYKVYAGRRIERIDYKLRYNGTTKPIRQHHVPPNLRSWLSGVIADYAKT